MLTRTKIIIFDIEQNTEKKKKDGSGTYKTSIVRGKTSSGQGKDFLIMQGTVDKSAELKAALDSLTMGDTATIVEEQREGTKFTNVVGVHKGDNPDAGSQVVPWSSGGGSNTYQKKSYDTTDKDIGAQIGNALNVASLLLANKVEKGSLKEVAERVLYWGEELKAKLKAGVYNHVGEVKKDTRPPVTNTFVADDSIPFE